MIFCPFCGAMVVKPPNFHMRANRLVRLDNEIGQGCLCRITVDQIQQRLILFRQKTQEFLDTFFPSMSLDQIQEKVVALLPNDPIRVEHAARMQHLERLRSRMEVLQNEALEQTAKEEAVKPEKLASKPALSLHEWLTSYRK